MRQQDKLQTMGIIDEEFNELDRHGKDTEKYVLNSLNHRFETYLNRIKDLAKLNQNLHEQIDGFYEKSNANVNEQSSYRLVKKFRELCLEINEQVRENVHIEIRSQRAEYDRKSYGNHLKIVLMNEQDSKDSILKYEYEVDSKSSELTQWEKHYEHRKKDLQVFSLLSQHPSSFS